MHSVECRIQHPDRFHFVFCQSPKKNTRGGINFSSAASIKAGGSQEICSFPRLNRGYIPRSVAKNDAGFTQENSSINARNRETADFFAQEQPPDLLQQNSVCAGVCCVRTFLYSEFAEILCLHDVDSERNAAKIRMQENGQTLHYDLESFNVCVSHCGEEA